MLNRASIVQSIACFSKSSGDLYLFCKYQTKTNPFYQLYFSANIETTSAIHPEKGCAGTALVVVLLPQETGRLVLPQNRGAASCRRAPPAPPAGAPTAAGSTALYRAE